MPLVFGQLFGLKGAIASLVGAYVGHAVYDLTHSGE
jgi:hypothetical protein